MGTSQTQQDSACITRLVKHRFASFETFDLQTFETGQYQNERQGDDVPQGTKKPGHVPGPFFPKRLFVGRVLMAKWQVDRLGSALYLRLGLLNLGRVPQGSQGFCRRASLGVACPFGFWLRSENLI